MKESLQQALNNTELMYTDLVSIADGIVNYYTQDINDLVSQAGTSIESLSNEGIRTLMLKLSLKSFSFGDVKEKSSLKATCAEAVKAEKLAKEFNGSEGSVVQRNNYALLEASNEVLTEAIYNLVASLFKTKLDELHRLVDTLKTILMSRLSEAKLNVSLADKDVGL